MRGRIGTLATLGVLLLLAPNLEASLGVVDPTAHTRSTKELWQLAFKSSDVVLLGRVLAPVSPPDTAFARGGAGARGFSTVYVKLEPVDHLKGALDGMAGPAHCGRGFDRGDLVPLARGGTGWVLAKIWTHIPTNGKRSSDPALERELQDGLMALPQRRCYETTEQVRAWILEMPPDSSRAKPSP